MEFKSKRLITVLVILFISKFVFSENPKILKSSNNPVHGNLNLQLKRDLILGEEASGPYFFASVKGIEQRDRFIYVLDPRMAKVRVYDMKGKFTRDIGGKGQGPGEFMLPGWFSLSVNGDIYIYDLMTRIMSVFNNEGNFKRAFKMEKILYFPKGSFYVDENDNIYALFDEFESETDLKDFTHFAKFNSEGKLEKIFYKTLHFMGIVEESGGSKYRLIYENPYMSNLYFTTLFSKGIFVLMNSLKYELMNLSRNGEILVRIVKDEKSTKVTLKEKEAVFSKELSGIPKHLQKYATFSETRPYCSNLLSDEKGRIYVERFKPVTDKSSSYTYDIFNSKGEFLYKLTLNFKIELIRNGYIYTVSTDEEKGQIKIIRFRVENWNEIEAPSKTWNHLPFNPSLLHSLSKNIPQQTEGTEQGS